MTTFSIRIKNDEGMSELVPLLLAHGKKESNLTDPRWQTKECKQLVTEGYRKKMDFLVEDAKAWVLVSLEKSRLLRSSVPDRILLPREKLTHTGYSSKDVDVNGAGWCANFFNK